MGAGPSSCFSAGDYLTDEEKVSLMRILEQVQSLIAGGEHADAWALISSAVREEPHNAHLALAAFHVASLLGLRRDSRVLLARAAICAESPLVMCRIGDALRAESRFSEAVRQYERALAAKPGYGEAERGIYYSLRDGGKDSRARTRLDRMEKRDPPAEWVIMERARLAAVRGEADRAVQILLQRPTGETLLAAAEIMIRESRFAEAREALEKADLLMPGDIRVLYRLAKEHERMNDRNRAVEYIEKCQSIFHTPHLLEFQKIELLDARARRALITSAIERVNRAALDGARRKLDLIYGEAAVLHPLRGVEPFKGFTIHLVHYCPTGVWPGKDRAGEIEALRLAVQEFLNGLGGKDAFTCRAGSPAGGRESYESMRRAIVLRNTALVARCALGRKLHREGEALVVLVESPEAEASDTVGFGGYRHVVLRGGAPSSTRATSIAHEIAHAVLDLPHTDGVKDLNDPFSILGVIGEDNTLDCAYLNIVQRLRISAPPHVQRTVTRAHLLDRRALGSRIFSLEERRGIAERALEGYRTALREDPLYLGIYPRAATLCLFLERIDEALFLLERFNVLYPLADHCAKSAEILINLGRIEEALDLFRRAPGWGTSDIVWQRAGLAFSRGCRFREAGRFFRNALALAPREPSNIFNMAMYYHGVRKFDKALEMYRKALSIEARWPQVRNRMALLLAQMGKEKEALSELRASARLRQSGMDLHFFRGRTFFQLGDIDEAIASMERALRIEPREQGSRYYLAYYLLSARLADEARDSFVEARALEAVSFIGKAAGAFIRYLDGAFYRALRDAKGLLRRNPHHSMLEALCLLCCRALEDRAGENHYRAALSESEPRNPLQNK
jgi:tetratricopeptide (TPR) repeat protein